MASNAGLLFWDLDGTLIDSLLLKGELFAQIFDDYPESRDELVAYHLEHSGLDRRQKIRRMGTDVLHIDESEDRIEFRAGRFGILIKQRIHEANLAHDSVKTLRNLATTCQMHVITAMPQDEALLVVKHHKIHDYFDTISGFPTPKSAYIDAILSGYPQRPAAAVVGDSIEDYSTAARSGIDFFQVRLRSAAPITGAIAILDGFEAADEKIRLALS